MTPEIQALITRLECEAKLLRLSCPDTPILRHRLPTLFEEAAAALVQQAQLLEEKEQDLTRVDEHIVMPSERATALGNTPNR